ncbi:hypothetical protein UA08_06348 [Talaromyces atroroseus]|uniref:Uncharacterized protein n=1 Tax=Talaromyces atroroseus TaxID=1441469 RepID=A0A225AGY5_TALAT|nr:hypothetical protein UA08_06348 [Talaromyces atroroseus]OKL58473.1 hypothetical protein UA08_06348 [Talaromyces atroroseus]
MRVQSFVIFLLFLFVHGRYAPGPAIFPLNLSAADESIGELQTTLDDAVNSLLLSSSKGGIRLSDEGVSSWAVQLTSSEETLWSSFHTPNALLKDDDMKQTKVDGDTTFRIASISKTITVYALLRENSINLDDPVTLYIPELIQGVQEPWLVHWDQVTLRSLASFLSGMPRDTGGPCFVWRELSELGYNLGGDSVESPLDTASSIKVLENKSCTALDVIDRARVAPRVFAVNDRPTYSNAAFSLLGIVLERATGLSFEEAVRKSILDPLELSNTTTQTPPKSKGIIPPISNHWDTLLGAADATPNDMSKYLRSILNAELLPRNTINAWLKPHSWTNSGTSTAYGLGWEFLRTTRLTYDGRPLEIISKAGALHGYHSWVMLLPELGLGLSVMVAGTVNTMEAIRETVVTALIPPIELIARKRAIARYAGVYRVDNVKNESHIRISVDENGPGIYIAEWVYNNRDILSLYGAVEGMPTQRASWTAKLIPANLPGTGSNLEMWRVICLSKYETDGKDNLFGDFHLTDIDDINYGQHGLGDIRIVLDENSHASKIDIPALGMKLRRITYEPNRTEEPSNLAGFYPSFEL